MPDGAVTGWPRVLLRLEGGVLLAAAVAANAALGGSWLLFAAVLFLPDVGIAGYAAGTRVGAAAYNAVHTELGPAALAAAGWAAGSNAVLAVALAWFAHVGLDRLCGFGLKHGDSFRHTHLGMLGGRRGADGTGRAGHP